MQKHRNGDTHSNPDVILDALSGNRLDYYRFLDISTAIDTEFIVTQFHFFAPSYFVTMKHWMLGVVHSAIWLKYFVMIESQRANKKLKGKKVFLDVVLFGVAEKV